MQLKWIALAVTLSTFAGAQKVELCAGVGKFGDENYLFQRANGQLLGGLQFQHTPALSPTTDGIDLKELKTILQTVGVKLIVVPIPVGGLFLTDNEAPKGYVPSVERQNFNTYLSFINSYGVTAVNLLPTGQAVERGGRTFIALHDHHWTDEGLFQSAQKLAAVALAAGVPVGQTKVDLTPIPSEYGGTSASILQKTCNITVPVEKRTLYRSTSQIDLLGDEPVTAVSTGDSYAYSYFGLHSVLSSLLKTNVLDASINGGGFASGIMNYLMRTASPQQKPNVIFWTATGLPMTSIVLKELKPALAYAFLPHKVVKTWDMVDGKVAPSIKLNPAKRYFIGLSFTGSKVENIQINLNTNLGPDGHGYGRKEDTPSPTYTTTFLHEVRAGAANLQDVSVNVTGTPATLSLYEYPISLDQ
ncbi:alginate O-acetyltransferase AlgX-related protein [Deinococcus sp. UYEF24]